jgi:hypothetical protein
LRRAGTGQQHRQAGGQRIAQRKPQVVVRNQQAGAAVFDEECHFRRGEMPIDRAVVAAQPLAGLDDLQIRQAVAQ